MEMSEIVYSPTAVGKNKTILQPLEVQDIESERSAKAVLYDVISFAWFCSSTHQHTFISPEDGPFNLYEHV